MYLKYRKCPLCLGKKWLVLFILNKKQKLVKCEDCGLIFNDRYNDAVREIYEDNYYEFDRRKKNKGGYFNYNLMEEAVKKDYNFATEFLKKKYKVGDRVLEVGCGYGFFLKNLLNSGIVKKKFLYGIEISKKAASISSKYGLIKNSKLETSVFKNKFNYILIFEVIEHLPQPKELINFAEKYLQIGGYLILTTPDISSIWFKFLKKRWPAVQPYFHNVYFDHDSIKKLFGKNYKLVYLKKRQILRKPWKQLRIRFCELFPILNSFLKLTYKFDNILVPFLSGGSMELIFKKIK